MRDRLSPARGVTLLEILIVLTIMLMITAATLPVVLPAIQNRRMREASRLVSTFISGARSRAIETGRPVGVMFERVNGLPFAQTISYVEIPPPYAGDTLNTKLVLTGTTITGVTPPGSVTPGLVRFGDRIRFDVKGPLYVLASNLIGVDPNVGQVADLTSGSCYLHDPAIWTTAATLPPNFGATGLSFQVFRQPVRSSATPLQLPEGTVVDLMNSGMTLGGTFQPVPVTNPPVPFDPVVIFSPQGRVDHVSSWQRNPMPPNNLIFTLVRPIGQIFFLIGRRELMADVSKSLTDENLYDPNVTGSGVQTNLHLLNFWVSVTQTGQINVAENANNPADPSVARQFAQSGQGAGGR